MRRYGHGGWLHLRSVRWVGGRPHPTAIELSGVRRQRECIEWPQPDLRHLWGKRQGHQHQFLFCLRGNWAGDLYALRRGREDLILRCSSWWERGGGPQPRGMRREKDTPTSQHRKMNISD